MFYTVVNSSTYAVEVFHSIRAMSMILAKRNEYFFSEHEYATGAKPITSAHLEKKIRESTEQIRLFRKGTRDWDYTIQKHLP